MKVEMNRQDLLELYQLVVMYTRCYDSELGELLKEISEKYKNNTGGEDIRSSRNPRCAGRKRVYAENTDRTILSAADSRFLKTSKQYWSVSEETHLFFCL